MKLPRASGPIALASIVSLGAQVLFSLVMLRLFAPQAVGEFSVISQIAFFLDDAGAGAKSAKAAGGRTPASYPSRAPPCAPACCGWGSCCQ
ncbi:hypothetical protein LP416_12585 [Polaromonas sp. P2-4]|nr:hypothetical protein LP416_12585 [Polaromonas sp. P2-4]